MILTVNASFPTVGILTNSDVEDPPFKLLLVTFFLYNSFSSKSLTDNDRFLAVALFSKLDIVTERLTCHLSIGMLVTGTSIQSSGL